MNVLEILTRDRVTRAISIICYVIHPGSAHVNVGGVRQQRHCALLQALAIPVATRTIAMMVVRDGCQVPVLKKGLSKQFSYTEGRRNPNSSWMLALLPALHDLGKDTTLVGTVKVFGKMQRRLCLRSRLGLLGLKFTGSGLFGVFVDMGSASQCQDSLV